VFPQRKTWSANSTVSATLQISSTGMMDIFLGNRLTRAPTFSVTSKSDPFISHLMVRMGAHIFSLKDACLLDLSPTFITLKRTNLCNIHDCDYQDAECNSLLHIHLPRKECLFCPGRQHSLLKLNRAL
jgi:hypothetical protein